MSQVDPTNVHHVEIYHSTDGFRWRAKAANGEIVAEGEAYTRLQDALRATWQIFPDVEEHRELVNEEDDSAQY